MNCLCSAVCYDTMLQKLSKTAFYLAVEEKVLEKEAENGLGSLEYMHSFWGPGLVINC